MLKSKEKVLVVSHDAGGAELVAAWVEKNFHYYEFQFLIAGPAIAIFSQRIANLDELSCNCLEQMSRPDWVLASTGWGKFEKNAMHACRQQAIPIYAYLDHWCNYMERFELNSEYVLPDKIWVGDREAEKLAKKIFPKVVINYVENLYLQEIKKKIENFPTNKTDQMITNILFVSEPLALSAEKLYGNSLHWGFTEIDSLRIFLNQLEHHNDTSRVRIVIRPHPSENKNKFEKFFDDHRKFSLILSKGNSLVKDIAESDWVVGINSMALVVALMVGKRTVSCIPENSPLFRLPFDMVERWSCDEAKTNS